MANEKLPLKFDTTCSDKPQCPFCGHELRCFNELLDELDGTTTTECANCESELEVEWSARFTFSTRPTVKVKDDSTDVKL